MANGISGGANPFKNIAVESNEKIDKLLNDIDVKGKGSDIDSLSDAAKERMDEIDRQISELEDGFADAAKPTALEYLSTVMDGLSGITAALGTSMGAAGKTGASDKTSTQSKLDAAIKNYDVNKPETVNALNAELTTAKARSAEITEQLSPLQDQLKDFNATSDKADYFKNQASSVLTDNAKTIDEQNKIIQANVTIENGLKDENIQLTAQKADIQEGTDAAQASKDENTEQKGLMQATIQDINGNEVEVKETKEGAIKNWQAATKEVSNLESTISNLNGELTQLNSDLTKAQNASYTKTDSDGNQVEDTAARQSAINKVQGQITAKKQEIDTAQKQKEAKEAEVKQYAQQIQVGEQTLADLSAKKTEATQARDTAINNIQTAVNDLTKLKAKDTEVSSNLTNIAENLKKTTESTGNAQAATQVVEAANKDISAMSLDADKVKEKAKETKKDLEAKINTLTTEQKSLNKSIEKAEAKISKAGKKDEKADATTPDGATVTDNKKDGMISTPDGVVPGTGMPATDNLLGAIAIDKKASAEGYAKNGDGTYTKGGQTYKYDEQKKDFVPIEKSIPERKNFFGGDDDESIVLKGAEGAEN